MRRRARTKWETKECFLLESKTTMSPLQGETLAEQWRYLSARQQGFPPNPQGMSFRDHLHAFKKTLGPGERKVSP